MGPAGSGTWWIRYHDAEGKEHREKIGSKSLARQAYAKRKTQVREGQFFPETLLRRKTILLRDFIQGYLQEAKANHRAYRNDESHARSWTRTFGDLAMEDLTADIIGGLDVLDATVPDYPRDNSNPEPFFRLRNTTDVIFDFFKSLLEKVMGVSQPEDLVAVGQGAVAQGAQAGESFSSARRQHQDGPELIVLLAVLEPGPQLLQSLGLVGGWLLAAVFTVIA